jgi:hypothetical protein
MSSITRKFPSLFSDKVFTSTDLNRRASDVLSCAAKGPVTISRNNEQFALLRREQVGGMVGTIGAICVASGVLLEIEYVLTACSSRRTSFAWLEVYEKDDLEKFRHELLAAMESVSAQEADFEEIHTIIHEWRESALVVKSGVIDDPMHTPPEGRIEIPPPAKQEVETLESESCDA